MSSQRAEAPDEDGGTSGTGIRRVLRSHQEAREAYDRLSRWYDWLEGKWEETPRHLGVEMLGLEVGEHVLEVGFGTGHGLVELAGLVGSKGRVYGLDLSLGMVRETRRRLRKESVDNVQLLSGDTLQIPLADDSVDAVFLSFTLELLDTPEIPRALAEYRRVLRHGTAGKRPGRVGIVALSKEGKSSLPTRIYEWGHDHFPSALDCRPIYARRALEEAGFEIDAFEMTSIGNLKAEVVVGLNR